MDQVGTRQHTLVITNDFPPRPGGIQTFVYELVRRFEPSTVTVLTSSWEGAAEFDAEQPFEVIRMKTSVLLPTRSLRKRAREIVVSKKVDSVVYGAAAPLALMASEMRALGVQHQVGITHGHEAGWAITPVTRQLLAKIGRSVDTLTYLGSYTKNKIGAVLDLSAAKAMRQLTPGVDCAQFHPNNRVHGDVLRESIGFTGRPTIVCVSRLMERKGQDTLLKAMPRVLDALPDAALIIVGSGGFEPSLQKIVAAHGLELAVHFTGKVPFAELAHWYAAGDVFAMPCRTRNGGWDVEGLGIVFLEASATGLAVIAGDSGGAPDAVLDGQTGVVVDGTDVSLVANELVRLLSDRELAQQMGAAGRAWVEDRWTWERSFKRLELLLVGLDPDV